MSSTDDLSSRPHSPSMSSSDESYSKTTENEEGTDSPLPPPNQMLRIANPLQWLYPGDIQVDPTVQLSPMELAHLKEFDISSTTESHAPSTVPGGTKGESCNSFEYLNDRDRYPKSPFEREIQRLLESSNKAAIKEVVTNGNKTTSGSSSGGSVKGETGEANHEKIGVQKINNQSILMCGLDAIREIARKNPSDSSQMQTSDTESCEIINDIRRNMVTSTKTDQLRSPNEPYFQRPPVSKSFIVRKESLKSAEGNADTDDNELMEDEIHQNYISDALKYGAGHQSMDSNPLESQSEWSDEELREEATGKIFSLHQVLDLDPTLALCHCKLYSKLFF